MAENTVEIETPLGKGVITFLSEKRAHLKIVQALVGKIISTLETTLVLNDADTATLLRVKTRGRRSDNLISVNAADVWQGVSLQNPNASGQWRMRSPGARMKAASVVWPIVLRVMRESKLKLSVLGIEVLRKQAKGFKENADYYARYSKQYAMDGAHCEALADELERSVAWAVETVADARPDAIV